MKKGTFVPFNLTATFCAPRDATIAHKENRDNRALRVDQAHGCVLAVKARFAQVLASDAPQAFHRPFVDFARVQDIQRVALLHLNGARGAVGKDMPKVSPHKVNPLPF